MATNPDPTEYPSYDLKGKVVKTITIKGQTGKQIKIESTSVQLYSGKDGNVNNTVVSVNGVPYAAWNWDDNKYSDVLTYNKYPVLVEAGKDAVITWTVKTTDKTISAKFKNAAYTYSYVDVATDEPVTETKNPFVVIECTDENEAKETVTKIKAKGILSDDMKMYIAKSV